MSKFIGEKLVEINKNYHQQSSVIRFPSVIGANHHGGIIHDFRSWIEDGSDLDLYDRGLKYRNVIHVNDAVRSILLVIESFEKLDNYEEFNIGSRDSKTMHQILKLMLNLMKKNNNINLLEKVTNSNDIFIDNSNAVAKIGFKPVTIEHGIRTYLKEYNYEV